jgi:hypothetical protein
LRQYQAPDHEKDDEGDDAEAAGTSQLVNHANEQGTENAGDQTATLKKATRRATPTSGIKNSW